MQIIKFNQHRERVYCPVTGNIICDGTKDEKVHAAKSLKAWWNVGIESLQDMCGFFNDKLKAAWEKTYEEAQDYETSLSDVELLEKFLEAYQEDGWVCFATTFAVQTCTSLELTSYYIIDLGYTSHET